MNDALGFFSFILTIAGIALIVATILLPFYVIIINGRLREVSKTLAKMEDMMRNGR